MKLDKGQRSDFVPKKRTTDATFAVMMLIEKNREGQRKLHCVFVDLRKLMTGYQERSYGIV